MSIIQLHSGNYLDLLKPRPDDIHIKDIAHALSNICRFTGHTSMFYSVAQHSMLVSELVEDPMLRKAALLHDAAEAYIGDVSTPLKRIIEPIYKEIESRLEAAIAERFSISCSKHQAVKQADLIALVTEKRDLMIKNDEDADFWPELSLITPHQTKIHPLPPEVACQSYLRVYRRILVDEGTSRETIRDAIIA